jgi:hypothetical protein
MIFQRISVLLLLFFQFVSSRCFFLIHHPRYDNYDPFGYSSMFYLSGQVLIAQQLTPEQQMIFETSTLKHRRALFAKGILRPAMAVAGESEDCSICYEAMELSLGR